MAQGRLPFDRAMADGFAHVNWTELNERHRRDYAAAVREVVDERGLDAAQADAAAMTAAIERLNALFIIFFISVLLFSTDSHSFSTLVFCAYILSIKYVSFSVNLS